jgi:hypothetical protein
MKYTQILEVRKQIKKLDIQVSKLYKEYNSLSTQQEQTACDDVYVLIIQKLDEVNSRIIEISSKREILIDSI